MYFSMDAFVKKVAIRIIFCALVLLIWANAKGIAVASFSAEKASFAMRVKNELVRNRVMGVFVLPGKKLSLEILESNRVNKFTLYAGSGELKKVAFNRWVWRAPKKARVYSLKVINSQSSETITINAFVMVPFNRVKNGYLNGYRIGSYPRVSTLTLPSYRSPRGFIEVTKSNGDTLLSPHFRLNQFLCKQKGGFPKYVVLTERLLLKLEMILEAANRMGHSASTFQIMSGYRTPYYNRAIGNVRNSRHLFGDAADIFIDENPKDGVMDDLNSDGKIDRRDAGVLYGIIDEIFGKTIYTRLTGGLARYEKTDFHGPFVHVDARGYRARW